MRFAIVAVLGLLAVAPSARAGDAPAQVVTPDGTLNPETLTLNAIVNDHDFSKGSLTYCTYGMLAAKTGRFEDSLNIFRQCSDRGSDPSSLWMSFLSEQGLGTRQSDEDAAGWAKKAADRGWKVGQYDYGLMLMKGKGVAKDVEEGKRMIGLAAEQGYGAAKDLIEGGYNLDQAMPDPTHAAMPEYRDLLLY